MQRFMLLMRGDDPVGTSPSEMQARMQAYMAWMKSMTDAGALEAGEPLGPSGRLLKDKATVLTDGPFLEPKEVIGGYVIIRASDLDAATAIAKECPLLNHCEIMVRPLLEMPG